MRGAARGSGVTAAALYHHFADREELLTEVVRIGHELLLEYFQRASHATSPLERFRDGWDAYVDFAIEHPRDYEVLFLDPETAVRRYPEELTAGESPTFGFLIDCIRECIVAGDLRAAGVHEVGLLVWSAVHGLCSLHLCGRFGDDSRFRAIARRQREVLLSALESPGSTRR